MSKIPPATLQIRTPTPADAEEIVAYVARLTNEPHNNISRDPGQWTMTVEQEREFLEKAVIDEDRAIFVATLEGKIVGMADLDRHRLPTARHSGALGISVDAAYRHCGIGTALMRALIDWAKARGLRRVELGVYTRNTPAIELYLKLGFVIEGLHRMSRLKQGIWVDEYTMALFLDAPSAA